MILMLKNISMFGTSGNTFCYLSSDLTIFCKMEISGDEQHKKQHNEDLENCGNCGNSTGVLNWIDEMKSI